MNTPTEIRAKKPTVFYLIIAAALLYNLILAFAFKGKANQDHHHENEFTTSTLTK